MQQIFLCEVVLVKQLQGAFQVRGKPRCSQRVAETRCGVKDFGFEVRFSDFEAYKFL